MLMEDNAERCGMPRARKVLVAAVLGGVGLLGGAPTWPVAADGLATASPEVAPVSWTVCGLADYGLAATSCMSAS